MEKQQEPLQRGEILGAVEALREEAVSKLSELVSYPSLLGQEAEAQAAVARTFKQLGLEVEQFEVDKEKIRHHPGYSPSLIEYKGRNNVVGVHQPKGPVQGRSLILNGHIDVVPVGHPKLWSTPPFQPRVVGDRLYGRGAADMKAGIVAYMTAFTALRNLGYEPAATVYLQSVIEEECTGNGALACLVEGYTADAALIPEPSDEGVMSAQLGVLWLSIEVFGIPVHAAQAQEGISATAYAQYLVEQLRELERAWNEPSARHPVYCNHTHPINFNLGRIQGGEWPSSVPTHCKVDVRIGYYPGKKAAEVKAEIEEVLRQAHASHPQAAALQYEVGYGGFQGDGLVVDMEQPLIAMLMGCHSDLWERQPAQRAFTATTDVKFFHLYGSIPSTCYGPSGSSIHGIDEWVSIDSMQRVAAVYALFIARWCGLNRLH
ncbi:ArgE/DapE family deacylase [Variovorax paradoxus]|uniref:ArgE/DapE family deacylase n=1 Tax=Variovorax paradoxus TaxID=34073 RepID=UPI003ECE32B0